MKRKHIVKCLYLIIILTFVSCTPTNIVSLKDPTCEGKNFKRILVKAAYDKAVDIKNIELELATEFYDVGIVAYANHRLLPPLREYSDEERIAIYKKYNIDGFLVVYDQGYDTRKVHIPSYSTTKSNSKAVPQGSSETSETITSGGYSEDIISEKNTRIKLYDLENGHAIWRGDAVTSLNEESNYESYLRSLCEAIVEKLAQDGLILIKK